MTKIKWRFLNADRVEVTPEYREHAWKDLIVDEMQKMPKYDAFRTCVNRADFENFDYKTPIVYEINNKTVLINNEFFNKLLNRPRLYASASVVRPIQIFFAFICCVLLSILTAHIGTDDNDRTRTSPPPAPTPTPTTPSE
uniref:Per os infectivity factor 6 n=1 Tax=Lymantria dispar multicapsid nuclear polyhedrosis virus TaxID=10449 RepID=A0A1B1MQV7_NPVLD|nr:per os infectivity factor 6 [Lymantria dispar multiple nucleopolyhedrovirus]